MILITSDFHFSHRKMAEIRNFNSIDEHDEYMIEVWNQSVGKKDTIYHLGDFGFNLDKMQRILPRLNGKKIFIKGNHDHRKHVKILERHGEVHSMLEIRYNEQPVILCHFPLYFWNRSHYGSIHLFGHCHGNFEGIGKSIDVGIDVHKKPVTIDYAFDLANKKDKLCI